MTVLLIGGAYQGKRELAKRLFHLADADFACGESCTAKQLASAKAVDGLHRYVRRLLTAGESADGLAGLLAGKVVLCDEIGCGVVPFEKELEDWREKTGRLCCDMAERADLVIRVHAGIGQAIKGKLPENEP